VTITGDTTTGRSRTGFLRRLRRRPVDPVVVTEEEALVRALCHDLGTPLASLHALLGHLAREGADADPVAELALAQADSLVSMLRTASATGGALPAGGWPRALVDVVRASLQASGLPAGQVRLDVEPAAAEVPVGDARVQRILTNLLENAHRHGAGRPVEVAADVREGWVQLVVTQPGVPDRVVEHLQARRPPGDLTGLGLWSVQRQARELGGRVTCRRGPAGLGVVVDLPDR
ncbi:Histidine kinase-like ATPase domain-containing protein, partial [Klenkia terrae]|jgi:two-component system sensor histidine kinase KdpD